MFIILPDISASPDALLLIFSFAIANPGILAGFVLSANSTFIFSPVTPVACNTCPLVIGPPLVFLTRTTKSFASVADSADVAYDEEIANEAVKNASESE